MAKTILVVDDKANVRRLVREYLMEEGFRVIAAGNGSQACPWRARPSRTSFCSIS